MQITIIHNPVSGPGNRRLYCRVLELLSGAGARLSEHATEARGDAERLAAEAAEGGAERIVAAGGDGTINEVINGMAAAEEAPPLAILPLGTANVLAQEIGLARDAASIAATILDGTPRTVHPGRVNGRRFLQMVGAGFDAKVVAAVTPAMKRRFGKGAYVFVSARNLVGFSRPTYRVTIDGAAVEAASVVVANGRRYGGAYVIAPEADLARPGFEVCLFKRTGAWHAARYGLALLADRLPALADFEIVRAMRVSIEGRPGEPVQGDGDIVTTLPAEIGIDGRPLRLIYPNSAAF